MTGASAMSMFAALLDRSVARIGELAADARFFDRQEVVQLADIWDNNTRPLFGVAVSRPGWIRERRAKAALRWMADLGPSRRALMIEQAAAAGYRLEPLLGPPGPDRVHYRDHRGQVFPGEVELTAAAAASVADDYDLGLAEVQAVRVERAGHQLSGHVLLVAPRRYARPSDDVDAVVRVFLDDIRAVRFDSGHQVGATLESTATGVDFRVGGEVHLHAASATVTFDDRSWHLSRAGWAADATTPVRRVAPREARSRPLGDAAEAAFVLYLAMVMIRGVRHDEAVGRIPLRELCGVLTGAGDRILAAAARPPSARASAFRQLADSWIDGSPYLARQVARQFPEHPWRHKVPPADPARPEVAALPPRAQLTLAGYAAAHTSFGKPREASAVLNLAVPDDVGGWGLQALRFPRATLFSLDSAAFATPEAVSGAPDTGLALGHALTVTCREPDPARPH